MAENKKKLNTRERREIENLLTWFYRLDQGTPPKKELGAYQFVKSFLEHYRLSHPVEVAQCEAFYKAKLQNKPYRYPAGKEAFRAQQKPLMLHLREALVHEGLIEKRERR
ncbi:hypothetical protein [Alkalicoccus chagannorensis]|uniref:hypothetical protein n=1 Tax=Alkalicoccus chagannorensis TaxID=427072 RepID=UPI00040BDFA9|nr:hypothetical protein [Alkalicoccus chagannorensis]